MVAGKVLMAIIFYRGHFENVLIAIIFLSGGISENTN